MIPAITDVIDLIAVDKDKYGITLYGQATDEEIKIFESNKIELPDDVRAFYKFSNGFYSEEDMFRIIPLDEIMSNASDSYLDGEWSFHIAEYMIYCDMWTIKINPNNRNDYIIYNKVEDIITLTNSFAEFLDRFLLGGVFKGLYDWREQISRDIKR